MGGVDDKLTRIGIFYDGNFFFKVSNYYHYHHERRARLSIAGLHHFIRDQVAQRENTDARYCQIVDAHYFRGRLRASEAESRDLLYRERVFDDVLMREGVTTHYLPLSREGDEKGIDVWLALEAFELAIYKRFNVSVLVAGDGDFLPLVRKLNTIGTRVMLLGWDFRFQDPNGYEHETRTAQVLLDEVTYPVMMHQIIDDRARRNDPLLNGIFVPRRESVPAGFSAPRAPGVPAVDSGTLTGQVRELKNGYGWISPSQGGKDIYFYWQDVIEGDFNDLKPGSAVEYVADQNERGPCAKQVRAVAP